MSDQLIMILIILIILHPNPSSSILFLDLGVVEYGADGGEDSFHREVSIHSGMDSLGLVVTNKWGCRLVV